MASRDSAGSHHSLQNFTEENYRKLQMKVNEQAERLLKIKDSNSVGLIKQLEEKERVIDDMQRRNNEIAKGIINQVAIQERLRITEENLRKETAICEEQRAQIAILKQGLEANLQKLGLRFSIGQAGQPNQRGPLNQIDGYLQLMRYSQLNHELQAELGNMKDRFSHFQENHQEALKEQDLAHQDEIGALKQRQLQQLAEKDARHQLLLEEKGQIEQEKNELLDFVEQNQNKIKMMEDTERSALQQQEESARQLKDQQRMYQELLGQKKHQDELLKQVNANLNEMRIEREHLNNEVSQLKSDIESLGNNLSRNQEVLN